MTFAQKLRDEVHAPWKQYYIGYEQLKKLLKESATADYDWTEDDESRFVQLLDKELDKVYGFETTKYEEISSHLSKVESSVESLDFKQTQPKTLNENLESILDDATYLDHFRRLNYTGFVKVVRKHDRLHQQFRVMPLLQARFRAVPFHSEDYSPLLRRLGLIYAHMNEASGNKNLVSSSVTGTPFPSHKLNSVDKDYRSNGYITLQFWVHPDNLMEVKARILRKLPVLVYNREDDDDESERDPIVTSLYMDNRRFELYQSLLERGANRGTEEEQDSAVSLRFRWYGKLFDKPDIVLEKHNELTGRITRITVKEKQINKFLSGEKDVIKKQVRKMRDRRVQNQAVEDYKDAASELQDFVSQNRLEPMFRTVYRRTAFEIPGDDRVRVILDQDIMFIREDSLSRTRPIRDPAEWRRGDMDRSDVDPLSLLRKGEFARFPYSVLEVRLRTGAEAGIEKLPWIEELQKSNLIKEVPHFTKFLQGAAVLYGEDDHLDTLPFWLSDLDSKQFDDTSNPSGTATKSSGGADSGGTITRKSKQRAGPSRLLFPSYQLGWEDEDDEFDSEDSGILESPNDFAETGAGDENAAEHDDIGYPTRIGKFTEESEDEEVNLPTGVEQPGEWIKNQSAPKIEAKVWLANERTFNRWLHVTCLLSALTFTLYNSVGSASSSATATLVAYVLFGLTIFCGIWGYCQYILRMNYIKDRSDYAMDAPLGPIVVSVGLVIALVVNFTALYSKVDVHPQVDLQHVGSPSVLL